MEETANRCLEEFRVRNKDLYLCILYKINKKRDAKTTTIK
jgi:hypothetical protein